jgi:methanethiol oxidase
MAQSQNPANSSFRQSQFRWKTDPTFYPTARLAMESLPERYAYGVALAPDNKSRSDALLVVDVYASSGSYGKIVGQLNLPNIEDELHHFGWNACSTALCPYAPIDQ